MADAPEWWRRHRAIASAALVALLLAAGLAALHRLTREISLTQVQAAFGAIGRGRIVAALALTTLSYLALTLYDTLALVIIGRPLRWRVAALASFSSYTLSHNFGLALLTGGSARARVYGSVGLDAGDIARVVVIAGMTFWLGVVAVAAGALLVEPGALAIGRFALPEAGARALAVAAIATIAAGIGFAGRGGRQLRLARWRLPLPSAAQAMGQIGVATVDLAAAAGALFVLIPNAPPALLPTFLLAYALALIAVLVSHVPGGVGVFEAVVLGVVPADRTALFAALIAYRIIYYLLPLALAVVALGAHAARGSRLASGAQRLVDWLAPPALAAACFGGGGVLLLSGSLPAVPGRLHDLAAVLPLPFIEASHFAASLVGTGLLLIAPGLYRRLDGAFWSARALLLAGAAFSLAKGIDYEEAVVCLALAGVLQWSRGAFHRHTALVARPLSPGWLASVVVVVGAAVWTGFFAYKHVDYSSSLWWQFALGSDASRFLRASLGVGVGLAAAALWRLYLPAPTRTEVTAAGADIRAVLATADRTEAMLALTGDKRFLLSADGTAFVMYQVQGASWIVMADPVGAPDAWPDLLWRLRGMADAAQGRLFLYQISSDTLDIAVDMGLQIVKYGEEALIDLHRFSLEGSRMRSLRQTHRRLMRDGVAFQILPAAEAHDALPELARVSDEWQRAKGPREKGFSLGRFDPAYLREFDFAVARVDGRIVAFANIWRTAGREELSVDLMRHGVDAPAGVMDFLFVSLMLWGQGEGFGTFSLGLAPLSGIRHRPLAPVWAKAASFAFRHGERVYGFRGLRSYKEKFQPHWRPRYIAASSGPALIGGLRDLNRLILRGPVATPVRERESGRLREGGSKTSPSTWKLRAVAPG